MFASTINHLIDLHADQRPSLYRAGLKYFLDEILNSVKIINISIKNREMIHILIIFGQEA